MDDRGLRRPRSRRRVPAAAAFAAGIAIGLAIGLPVAHAVVDLVVLPSTAAASPSSTPPPSPTGSSAPSPTPSPTPRPTPTPVPLEVPACTPLAPGQPPLEALASPPPGYRIDASLDWLGCGDQVVPRQGALTASGSWLLAVSFTCPPAASASPSPSPSVSPSATPSASAPALAVTERAAAGSVSLVLAALRGDAGTTLRSGSGGAPLSTEGRLLDVTSAAPCLWHVAVYPSAAGR